MLVPVLCVYLPGARSGVRHVANMVPFPTVLLAVVHIVITNRAISQALIKHHRGRRGDLDIGLT